MKDVLRRYLAPILGVLALAGAVTITIATDDDGQGHKTKTVTVKIGPRITAAAPTGPTGPVGELDSTKAEIQQLRDPVPDDIPKAVIKKADAHNDQLQEALPAKPVPVGGAQNYSIRKQSPLTTLGFGAYRSKVNEFCLHFTVSHNIPNSWADIYSVEDYLKRVGLNATYLADFDGHILQAGPTDRNPYTQGAFNQYCESVEIIAYGDETRQQWLSSNLFKKHILASFVRDRLLARGLPIRLVDPVGCNAPLGYTDHRRLECGNDHVDVGLAFPFDVFQKQLTERPKVKITKHDRAQCAGVYRWRHRPHHTKKGTALKSRRLAAQRARGHRCVGGKVKQRA